MSLTWPLGAACLEVHWLAEACALMTQELFIFFSSVQLSRVQLFTTPRIAACRPPCPSPTPGVYPNPCPSSWWCHPAVSSLVFPSSSCPQSLPSSGSFPMSQPFSRGGWSTRVSASTSVPPMNTQDWSPLGWTGWISLQSKGLASLLQHHSSKASILQCSAFFIVPTLTSIPKSIVYNNNIMSKKKQCTYFN